MKRALSLTVAIVMLLSSLVFAPAAIAADDPVVSRFVVVSDIHTNPTSTKTTIDRLPKVFETAYAYAETQGGNIDAFVFNGDSINGNETAAGYTNEDEMALFLAGVRDNVKNGSKVLLAMARTHDIYDGDGNIFYMQEAELNALIKEHLGNDGSIIPTADWGYGPHLNYVSGVPVITLSNDMGNGNDVTAEDDGNTGNDDNADNSYHDCEDWLDTQLAALVAENAERPIFVVFHYPEVGKLGLTQRWGQNSLRDTLNKYPQVITMNAHVHWDPRLSDSITQDLFTEVYDGAVRDTGGPNATSVSGGSSPIVSYSMIEVTESGAVTIKYIDPDTGDFLLEANGSGEVLEYSIPKAWDKSTYLYTDEAKFATEKATFAADASIKLENGTLTFDRADSEHPIIRYRVDVSNGTTTKTQYVFSELYNKVLPETYSTTLQLKTGVEYTITVTAIDGIYRESANTLVLTGNVNDPEKVLTGSATAVVEKTYGENGEKGEIDYPDFKTYATNIDVENITNWGISDIEDLKAWSEFSKVNSCTGLTFHLENDIDMKDQIFGMIGSLYVPFKGTFDGHLHTLSNLLIDDVSAMGTGFFVYTLDAEIRNFGIESGVVKGHSSNRKYENAGSYNAATNAKRNPFIDVIGVGAIAGRADNTTFTHVWNGADVTFRDGHMTGLGISNPCYAGLVGRAQLSCNFVGCYNTGDVHGLDRASGITNWAQSGGNIARISNCFNLGNITCEAGYETEAIGRFNTASSSDRTYFNYNNYYLAGSADIANNRASDTGYIVAGAEEPIALTAEEVKTDLANLLNAGRFTGLYADTATWATDADGNIYIASVDDTGASDIYPFSTYATDSTHTYYSINSLDEFNAFATKSKSDQFAGKVILLNVDLDLSSIEDFQMIGTDTYSFKGTFDGKGHTISNMAIATAGATRGLFRDIEGTVKNFTLKDASVGATQDCGMVSAKITGGTIENVTVKGGTMTISSNNDFGGIVGTTDGTTTATVKNCTVDGLTMNGSSRQGLGGIIGNAAYITVDGCKVINCTISGNRNNGLLGGYVYHGSTFKNCITYGNTFRSNFNTYGLVGRGGTKSGTDNLITVENCVFYDETMTTTTITNNTSNNIARTENFVLFRFSDTENIVTNNVYTASPDDCDYTSADVIHTNATELAGGKIAYELGWTMKDGYVALLAKGDEATHRYTYVMGETTEVRYTDAAGTVINGAPTVTAEDFLGWSVKDDAKSGDLVYTAEYGTEDTGSYPITELVNRPKATKFTIATPEELCYLATLSKTNTFEGYTITLLNDIDMTGVENFEMIGSESCRFTANFDGGNHTIYNVTISSSDTYAGFFSMTGVDKTKNVTIKDLTIEDAAITGGESSAILIGKAYGVTTLENVKLRYSSMVGSKFTVGGFFGKLDANTASFTVKNCVAEGCYVSNLSAGQQQAGLIVGGNPYNVIVENCLLVSNTVESHRQVGLIASYATANMKINGVIAYGNTINCNYDSAGILGRGSGAFDVQNLIAYNNSGLRNKSGSDVITAKNSTVFWMLGRYDTDNPTPTGSNVYIDVENDTTLSPVTVTTVTDEQVKSGEVAYLLGMAMENNNIAFPDADTKAAVKYTYIVNGTVAATRYTDGAGNMIGTEASLPEDFDEWTVTEDENGDKTFSVANEYDPDGTYPISKMEAYPLAKKFSVSTAEEFKLFADLVNAGKIGSDITILQTANIDLKDYPNVQVGSGRSTDVSAIVAFEATYDGQNYTISNYSLTKSDVGQGLFKNLMGTIKNLVIDNATVSVASHSGIVAGETYSATNLIENVHIRNSTITASARRVAFFVYGYNTSGATVNIKNCTVSGSTINSGTTANNPVGLITIRDEVAGSVIENTYAFNNIINVQATGVAVSGIVSDGRQTVITNCGAFNNTYTGTTPSAIYGINGTTVKTVTINNCYTDEAKLTNATFTGSNNYTGVTDTQLADGSLAYALKNDTDTNWIQKTYPQVAVGTAVTKHTYVVDGEEYALRYTDNTGAAIGTEVALPEGATLWLTATEANGDKTFTTVTAYDKDGTYPLAQYELYPDARKFTISTEAELNQLAALSKSNNFSGYTFTLTNDIDMSNTANFAMIGVGDNKDTCFAGTFDGAGYTVSNLKMNSTAQVGMFLPKNATIKNFTLKDADVRGGRYSGIVIASASNTHVSDVHIVGAYFNPNDDIRTYGGIAGYVYNEARGGGLSTFTRCSVQDSTFDCATNGGVGLLIGEMCAGTVTDCYVINNTVSALNRSGLLIGYSYGGTIQGCFTYGNTFTAETDGTSYPSGVVVGQVQTSATTVTNSVFCETDWDVYGYIVSGSITFTNCYTLCTAATAGTVSTAEQLASGELAWNTGLAMKNGKLALATETDRVVYKHVYEVDAVEYAVRYTDSTGAVIGEAVADPTKKSHTFLNWELAGGDERLELYAARFETNGDLDGDGAETTADATLLMQYLVGYEVELDLAAADINKDGKVSIFDAVKLLQSLSA
ncbi:MAG: hypothetical protein IJ043_10330 [Clostridia bacterium]|nr:hypothetical protein [Clostridia bacterium]